MNFKTWIRGDLEAVPLWAVQVLTLLFYTGLSRPSGTSLLPREHVPCTCLAHIFPRVSDGGRHLAWCVESPAHPKRGLSGSLINGTLSTIGIVCDDTPFVHLTPGLILRCKLARPKRVLFGSLMLPIQNKYVLVHSPQVGLLPAISAKLRFRSLIQDLVPAASFGHPLAHPPAASFRQGRTGSSTTSGHVPYQLCISDAKHIHVPLDYRRPVNSADELSD